jgi:hypothetical protein
MWDVIKNHRGAWLAVGVVVGLAVANYWPQAPLHASATASQENYSIATGYVDGLETEAVFFFDSLTGELKGAVISPQNGKFLTFFAANAMTDLGINDVAGAQFLMVTGTMDFKRSPGTAQLGTCVVYVTEVSSGQVVAYGVPWTKARSTANAPAEVPLVLLDRYQFRNVAVRPE